MEHMPLTPMAETNVVARRSVGIPRVWEGFTRAFSKFLVFWFVEIPAVSNFVCGYA